MFTRENVFYAERKLTRLLLLSAWAYA